MKESIILLYFLEEKGKDHDGILDMKKGS